MYKNIFRLFLFLLLTQLLYAQNPILDGIPPFKMGTKYKKFGNMFFMNYLEDSTKIYSHQPTMVLNKFCDNVQLGFHDDLLSYFDINFAENNFENNMQYFESFFGKPNTYNLEEKEAQWKQDYGFVKLEGRKLIISNFLIKKQPIIENNNNFSTGVSFYVLGIVGLIILFFFMRKLYSSSL